MQSLLAFHLPHPEDWISSELWADWFLLTLTFQMTASILQPFIGQFTDRKPMPYSLPIGMLFTLTGLLLLFHCTYLPAAAAGRVLDWHGLGGPSIRSLRAWARLASGGAGLDWRSQSFRLEETPDRAIGPLLAAFIVLPHGPARSGLVFARRTRCHSGADPGQPLV